jgi:hypothetical protein
MGMVSYIINKVLSVQLTGSIPAGSNEIGKVKLTDGTDTLAVNTDGSANVQITGSNVADAQALWIPGMTHNGITSDKPRGNTQGTLIASAARTATTLSSIQTNYNAVGILVSVDVTAVGGSGGLQVVLRGKDPVTNKSLDINNVPTAITTPGVYCYLYYPGATGTSFFIKTSYSVPVPRMFDVVVSHIDATSYTYSVGYSLIL